MTFFKCTCGAVHDSAKQGYCATVIKLDLPPMTPKQAGELIRETLLSLKSTSGGYATDALRREALDYAGLCWLQPGEMAPFCACTWSQEEPQGSREELESRLMELHKLWNDECITRAHISRSCSRGTKTCVVQHRT